MVWKALAAWLVARQCSTPACAHSRLQRRANQVPGSGIKIGIFTDPEGNNADVVETLAKP